MSNCVGIPLQLFSFLLLLLSPVLAYPPCSSLHLSSLTTAAINTLSTGCTLEPQDPFLINLQSITNLQHYQPQFTLINPKDIIQITILKRYNGYYHFETTRNGVSAVQNTHAASSGPIIFEVKDNSYSLSLSESPVKAFAKLASPSTYVLTVTILDPGFLSLSASPRLLDQKCGNGTYMMGGSCVRACPMKFYALDGICWRCLKACNDNRCVSETECNPCEDNQIYMQETKTCVDQCPETYFEDSRNRVCAKCEDGCTNCSYPDGKCDSGSQFSPVFYIVIAGVVLVSIIVGIYCWKKKNNSKKPQEKKPVKKRKQQPEQVPNGFSPKAKSKLAQLKRFGDALTPVGPYNIMPEPPENHDEDEEEMSPGGHNKKRRLTNFAQARITTVSASKVFEVDDDNHEQAVDHGSPKVKPRKMSSMPVMSVKGGESPAVKPRKVPRKSKKALSSRSRDTQENKTLHIAIDESETMQQSYGEISSPIILTSTTPQVNTSVSLGFIALKKIDTLDIPLSLEGAGQTSGRKEENTVVETVEEAEERDEEDEEKKEKEGYKPDLSLSISMDNDAMVDLMTCTICGMNRRDCVNKPCGHMVGCYACMKQFRESYGVCPKCKVPVLKLEKTGELKIKFKGAKKEEE